MAYIGRSVEYGNAATDSFVGSGSASYVLTYETTTAAAIVTLDGVVQKNGTDFNITGTGLVFTSVVAAPTVIQVVYLGLTLSLGTVADGTITNAKTDFQPGTIFKGNGSSTDGKITLNCSQNTHGVSIQSPNHASTASYTLTLPTTDGNANELLKTDGGGVLSWAVDSGGGPSLGTDHVIRTNAKTITASITFAGNENGMTAGPISISGSGVVVTVTSGSTWTIV